MNALTKLHMIAAERGDGLRPELLALFQQWQFAHGQDRKIEEIASYRTNAPIQAGPNPVATANGALPDGVLVFAGHKCPTVDELEHTRRRNI
jgi:hypothetical protein